MTTSTKLKFGTFAKISNLLKELKYNEGNVTFKKADLLDVATLTRTYNKNSVKVEIENNNVVIKTNVFNTTIITAIELTNSLTVNDCVTEWEMAIETYVNNAKQLAGGIYEHIVNKFGVQPDNVEYFKTTDMIEIDYKGVDGNPTYKSFKVDGNFEMDYYTKTL